MTASAAAAAAPNTSAGAGAEGVRFYKLSGSGNDFLFFDARGGLPPFAHDPVAVARLCARGTGVGADGVVFLDAPEPGAVRIVYLNGDGSRASLCGNATLCTARLAEHLGAVPAGRPFVIRTDAGDLTAWVAPGGDPAFALAPVCDVAADARDVRPPRVAAPFDARELRIGYALAGVPHLVVRVPDVRAVDVLERGRELRRPAAARPEGANVNFVSPAGDGAWHVRTFERGVEGETLACGTGAVACSAVLAAWGEGGRVARLITRSGRPLEVRLPDAPDRGPVLAGEGRLVFEGALRDWR